MSDQAITELPMAGVGGGSGLPAFDAGADPNRNTVTPGALCERLSEIQCAGEQHCCESPGRSREQCKQAMFDGCTNTLRLDAIAADPITGFDAAAAQAGFETFEAMAAQCDSSIADWGVSPTGLRAILTGTRAAGTSCDPGTLTDETKVGAALASCREPTSTACQPAQEGPFSVTWTCAPLSPIGGGCVTDANCQVGGHCDNPSKSIGTCAAQKALGTACTAANECASLFCKQGACVEVGVQPAYCLAN